MREVGINITGQQPTLLRVEDSKASSVVITMGCGDVCPYYPGQRHEDWELDDPAGQDLDTVRGIRDNIRERVERLLNELRPQPTSN
jgi:arsenate reductase (thioredoxin)